MRRTAIPFVMLVAFAVLVAAALPSQACPFCSAPSLTLSEQVAQSDAVVLVQWADGTKADGNQPGSTRYEVLRVVKQPSSVEGVPALQKGHSISLVRYRAGKPGDMFLLMGTLGTGIEWSSPLEVSETSFNYIVQAPSPEANSRERLTYFMKFLEYPDPVIANDAYAEFANAPLKEIVPLTDAMPHDDLREWVMSPETPPTRLGLYGLMLGFCGNEQDAELMKKKITQTTEDFRLGIDGVMFGYLLLTGSEGLEVVEKHKLSDEDVPFSETYAAMQAVRKLWEYGNGKVSKDRLRQSMRILLDRPELADLVIADLARWKDWSVQDRLMELYGAEGYDIPSVKRAIVRYMLVSSRDNSPDDGPTPEHVQAGKQHLDKLREMDPRTVHEAERFFFLN